MFASDLTKMPPLYIVGAGCDPFADHVLLYGSLLKDAGVPVKSKIYKVGLVSLSFIKEMNSSLKVLTGNAARIPRFSCSSSSRTRDGGDRRWDDVAY